MPISAGIISIWIADDRNSYVNFEKSLPGILPFLAKRAARAENRYSGVTTPIIMEHFMKPFAAEKAGMLEEEDR